MILYIYFKCVNYIVNILLTLDQDRLAVMSPFEEHYIWPHTFSQ